MGLRYLQMAGWAVSLMGAAITWGDDHVLPPGPWAIDCSVYPASCRGHCTQLSDCIASGRMFCDSYYDRLLQCATQTPPGPPIFVPPVECPAGQHLNDAGECQEDHECGDDEIGGGSEECEPCGDGEVPNPDGTACVSCDWGEMPLGPGTCRCDAESLDALANSTMRNIPPEPWERGGSFVCIGADPSVSNVTSSTEHETEKCVLEDEPPPIGAVAVTHSHPVFDWPDDEGKTCGGKVLETEFDVLSENVKGMGHSPDDMKYARFFGVPSYLSDSARVLLVYRKNANGTWEEKKVDR